MLYQKMQMVSYLHTYEEQMVGKIFSPALKQKKI